MHPDRLLVHAERAARPPFSLPGQQHRVRMPGGTSVVLYEADRQLAHDPDGTPLLLVHSINATANAFEMEPMYWLQARRRPVLALDLPGFGLSEKPDAAYSPAQMTAAIAAAIDWARLHLSPRPIDLAALSLSCEFSTETVLADPARVRSLTLISPTGMERRRAGERYDNGRTREQPWLRRLLRHNRLGQILYRLLTTRRSIQWFMARAWGTRDVDPRLIDQAKACASAPGAAHAPLDFVAGALFTRGVIERYRSLPVPVWVVHGTQGSFTSFGACPQHTGSVVGGATYALRRTAMHAGAMPHFQLPLAFDTAYQQFLEHLPAPSVPEFLRATAARPDGSLAQKRPGRMHPLPSASAGPPH